MTQDSADSVTQADDASNVVRREVAMDVGGMSPEDVGVMLVERLNEEITAAYADLVRGGIAPEQICIARWGPTFNVETGAIDLGAQVHVID